MHYALCDASSARLAKRYAKLSALYYFAFEKRSMSDITYINPLYQKAPLLPLYPLPFQGAMQAVLF
jgi:hypothetical protein